MKTIITALAIVFSLNSFAECRPAFEEDISHRLIQKKKIDKVGKITTGATFVAVGGFFGYMGVALLGPLWAGAVIGSSFGAIAAIPVGATFVVVSQVSKKKIKNRIDSLNIISEAEMGAIEPHAFEDLLHELQKNHPALNNEELTAMIKDLNNSGALCDGTISSSSTIKFASPKQIFKYIDAELSQGRVQLM